MRAWTHLHLRHFRCLVAVAQLGSLKDAAGQLGVTVPAVSKTLSELEDILGQPMLHRLRSGAQLTPAGEVFCRFAVASLRNVREAWDAVDPAGSQTSSPIQVGALPNVAASVLPETIARLLQEYSQARVDVHTGTNAELLAGLTAGRLDIVIGRMGEPVQMVGLSFEHLYSEPMVFASRNGHPILSLDGNFLEALQTTHVILPMPGTRIRRDADEFFARRGLPLPRLRIETLSASFAASMILQSDAIWFGPWGVMESGFEQQRFKLLPIDTLDSLGPVGLTMRQEQQWSRTGLQFLHNLRAVAALRRKEPWLKPLKDALAR